MRVSIAGLNFGLFGILEYFYAECREYLWNGSRVAGE
jgi:hypothetical protein